MFKHRYRFVILTLIIIALSLSAVYAGEDNSTLASDDSNQALGEEIHVTSGNYTELKTTVYNAHEGDVISIEGEYTSNGYYVTVRTPLTIQSSDGRAVINGNNGGGVYTNSSLCMRGIDFINVSISAKDCNLTLDDCRFYGGGVNFGGFNISVVNSTFSDSMITFENSGRTGEIAIGDSDFSGCYFKYFLMEELGNVDVCGSSFIGCEGKILTFEAAASRIINNTFADIKGTAFSITSSRLSFSGNKVRNISSISYLDCRELTFSNNTFKNASERFYLTCDELPLFNCTFEGMGEFRFETNRTEIIASRFIGSLSEASFINTKSAVIDKSQFIDSSDIRIFDCANITVSDSRFINNSCIYVFSFMEFCTISDCECINCPSRPLDMSASRFILNRTRFIDCNGTIHGSGDFEVSSCEFINSYNFICGHNTIIRDTRFINSTKDEYAFTAGSSSSGELFSMDNCTFQNVAKVCISPGEETVLITNSTFRNVGGDEYFIWAEAKRMIVTGNEFAINSTSGTIAWATNYDLDEVDVRITGNIFAYSTPRSPFFLISPYIDLVNDYERYLAQKTVLLKDNFYGFNIDKAEQVRKLALYGLYIKDSWINIQFENIGPGTYRLSFVDNLGNLVPLRDYTVSLRDKKTGDILKWVTLRGGIGEFEYGANLTLDDVYIMNNASTRVNRPEAKLLVYKTGTDYEDIQIHFRICDENGNPIPNADFEAFIYRDRDFVGIKTFDSYLASADANGEFILPNEFWVLPDHTIYSFELTYSDAVHGYTTFNLTGVTIVKSEAIILAGNFQTVYDSGKMPTITVTSKRTGRSADGFYARMNIYKGGKLVAFEDFEVYWSKAAFFGKLNLKPGKYRAVIVPDNNYNYFTARQVSFTITVKKLKATVKAPKVKAKFKKSKYFKVTLKAKGKALKGIKIKVKVFTGKKSKAYTLKTNKKGIAKLNTKKLKRGAHKVKISSTNACYSVSAKSKITIR